MPSEENLFRIITDFVLLSENKLKYRNSTANFWGWVSSWLLKSWHYFPAKHRQWENFLQVGVTDHVSLQIYISGLMQSLVSPPPLWKAAFRRQSHCTYSKTTKLGFNTFHFLLTVYTKKKNKHKTIKILLFNSELFHFKKYFENTSIIFFPWVTPIEMNWKITRGLKVSSRSFLFWIDTVVTAHMYFALAFTFVMALQRGAVLQNCFSLLVAGSSPSHRVWPLQLRSQQLCPCLWINETVLCYWDKLAQTIPPSLLNFLASEEAFPKLPVDYVLPAHCECCQCCLLTSAVIATVFWAEGEQSHCRNRNYPVFCSAPPL